MTTAPARTRKPAEDRRREIADAALRVIAAEGLGGFTSLAIARAVGLSDGALFRHFASKEAMVDAAIDRAEELLFEGFPPEAADPLERLGAFFCRRVAVVRGHPGITALVATDDLAKAGSAEGARRVALFRRRSTAFVRGCLAEAARSGRLVPGVGIEEATVIVLGALGTLAHSGPAPWRGQGGVLARRVWSTLEALLGRPAASPTSPPRRRRAPAAGRPPKGDPT